MTAKQSFRVAVAGLDMRDVRLIEIVFKHSQYNRYEFKLVNDIQAGALDLLIANAHDEAGKAAIFALRESDTSVPIIAAVPRGEASTAKHAISIDRLTLQLLPIINRVVELDLLSPETRPMDRQAQVKFAAAERVNQVERRNLATRFVPTPNNSVPPQRASDASMRAVGPLPGSVSNASAAAASAPPHPVVAPVPRQAAAHVPNHSPSHPLTHLATHQPTHQPTHHSTLQQPQPAAQPVAQLANPAAPQVQPQSAQALQEDNEFLAAIKRVNQVGKIEGDLFA